jgi:hypothetical protein
VIETDREMVTRSIGALAVVLLLAAWLGLATGAGAQQGESLPSGTIAQGQIDSVPTGDLVVGVLNGTVAAGESTVIEGPPGFLLNGDVPIEVREIEGGKQLARGEALFLPGGMAYTVANRGNGPAQIRFFGLGGAGEVEGASYETTPIPWGPGAGKAYYVTLTRSFFPGGSATPWHYHTGPAFGILDEGGAWENRQQDGSTLRIPTPGYYLQPALEHHQLAQVGSGGNALIFQFAPPGQGLTGGSDPRGAATPTSLALATPISETTPVALPTGEAARPTATPTPLSSPTADDSGVQVSGWALALTALAGIAAAAAWRLISRRRPGR